MPPSAPRAQLVPLGLADVVGRSMLPRLRPGDLLLVRWGARVRPGDVVVLRRPDRPDLVVVKRAVRAAGGGWWVLGDNAAESTDSRTFGAVPPAAVLARVLLRLPRGRVVGALGVALVVVGARRRQPAARRRAR